MADIKLRWTLDVVSRGAGAKVLKEDRAIRAGLIQTDAQYRKTAATAASVSARQAQAANRVATSTREAGTAQVAASDEVARYAAAQRELLSISSKIIQQQDALGAAYVRSGRAARSSAADQSLASRVRSKVSRAGGAVIGAGAAVGGALRNAASTAGIGIGLAGFAGLAVVAKETIGFDRAMRNVNSIAQLSETRLQGVNKQIRELAGKTAQAPITLAKGMYDLVSSGFSAKNSLTIVGAAARAATAGLSTTDVSTKAIAAVLNAYHQSASKAKAISDTLFQTVNFGVITFGELAEHIGTLLPFSASLGVNLKEDGAAISTLTKQGIRGELAITFLKNAMVAFLKPSAGMVKAVKATGAASGEALVKHKGFEGALNAVIKTTDGSKTAIAKLFPNIRSLTAALGLTGKNASSAAKDLAGFKNDTGATSKALSQQSQSVAYQWNKLKARASSLAIGLGQKLVPAASKVLGVLTKIGDKKSAVGGVVSTLLKGISAGITGHGAPSPKPTVLPTIPLVSGLPTPSLPGPFAPSHQHPFEPAKSVSTSEPSTLSKVGAAIGKAARTMGTAAVEAGKQLLDAFKPALPFLQNILLPLLLGIGKGILIAIVGAFKILVPIIKVVATTLGAFGRVAAPVKGVFEGIGDVVGIVFSGRILKLLSLIPRVGIAFRVLGAPIRLVTNLFGLAGRAIIAIFGRLGPLANGVGRVAGVLSRLAGVAGLVVTVGLMLKSAWEHVKNGFTSAERVANPACQGLELVAHGAVRLGDSAWHAAKSVISAIGSLPSKIGGLASSVLGAFAELGKNIVKAIIDGIKEAPNAIIDAVKSLVPGPMQGAVGKVLGFGESVVKGAGKLLGGRRGGRLGHGGFSRYQSGGMVDALVSPGEAIMYGNSTWTVPGPRIAADSVFTTLPVGAAVLTADGQARMGAGASLGEAIAMQAPHFRTGGVVTGKVSTFGPPSEPRGTTASGASSASRGIAVRPGATWQSGKATLGQYWQVSIGGHTGTLKQIDLGPNQSTGRRIDVTGAGAKYLGIDPAHFPTDSKGTATLLGKSKKGGGTSGGVTINLPIHLGKSRTRAGLVSDALTQGVDAGGAGLTRAEIDRAYRGARGAETNPILAAIQQAQTATTRKITIGGSKKGGNTGLVRPAAKWNPRNLPMANWIVPFLSWGAKRGWGGSVTSGWRSRAEQARIYASGIRPAAKPGTSNHEGKTFPSGAVDVTAAAQLSGVLAKRPGPHLLQWAGSKDPVHFSYPHNGSYRRGGIVKRYRAGGAVGGLPGRLREAVAFKGGSWQRLDEAIGRATEQRIEALRATLAHQVKAGGDKKTIQRLQGVLSLIDFEIGRRIGSFQLAITKRSTSIEHGQGHLERALRKQGIDPSSATGLVAQSAEDKRDEAIRKQNVASARAALKLAKKTGNRQQIAAATEQLVQAQEDLDEAATKGIEDSRALIIASTQELIDRTNKSVEEARGQLDRNLRKAGVEAGSGAGLIATIGIDETDVALRTSVIDSVSAALAKSTDPGASQQLSEQLKQARVELDESLTVQVEDRRALIRQVAQEGVDTAQFGIDSVQNALSGLDIAQRLNRTAETPGGEVQKAQAIQSQLLPALQSNLAALNSQLGALQSIGDTNGVRQTLLSIQQAGNEIASAMAESADLIRQAAEQAAQETVDRAAHGTSLAQLGEQRLELEERIAGTYNAGGQERADYINKTLIPALNSELYALSAQFETANKEGDATLANQIAEAIAGKQNDILQATLDATEEVAQNTNQRQVGGTLGFSYGQESISDALIAVGNGS